MASLADVGAGLRPRYVARTAQRWIWGAIVLAAVGAITLGPILVVVEGSFEARGTWPKVFASNAAREALGYSLLFALRAPFAALIGFFIAWLLIRIPIPGRGLIEFMFWIAFFLPLIPMTLGWTLLLDSHNGLLNELIKSWFPFVTESLFDVHSIGGIFWVHMTASSVPVLIILLGPAIRQLDASVEEAGRVCGSGALQVFRRITLPLLIPAIVTGTLLGFIRGLEAFEVEQLLGAPAKIFVYTTHVYALVNWEPPRFAEAMALSTLVLFLLLILALIYQRYTLGHSYATVTGTSMSLRQFTVGRWRWAIAAVLFLIVIVIVVVPMGFLVLGSMMKLFGMFGVKDPYTLAHWRLVLSDPAFLPSLRNTVVLGLGAAALGVALYAILAYVIARTKLATRGLSDFLAWLPWCVPGILLGVGLLALVLANPLLTPLYGSIALLIVAVTIAQLPLGVSMMKTSIHQIGIELEHASQVCGAGRPRTFVRIVLPLMKPMLISLFVLVAIAAIRDVATVLLIAQPKSLPLSVLMLEYATNGNTEPAAVVGIVTAALVIAIAVAARSFGLQIGRAR